MPLGKGYDAIEFKVFAIRKIKFLIEMVVNRSEDQDKFLTQLFALELRLTILRSLSSANQGCPETPSSARTKRQCSRKHTPG